MIQPLMFYVFDTNYRILLSLLYIIQYLTNCNFSNFLATHTITQDIYKKMPNFGFCYSSALYGRYTALKGRYTLAMASQMLFIQPKFFEYLILS
jgi:hypothetical protein